MADPKDKQVFVFNPFTGNFDAVLKFNPDRIVTAELNGAGHKRYVWDSVSNSFVEDGATVVIDNDGNVVTT